MTDREQLWAFLAVLLAICYLATVAAFLAGKGRYAEALGFGGLTTGLVGVLGTFKPSARKVEVENTAENPVPTTEARS